jgi:hypothetical protein
VTRPVAAKVNWAQFLFRSKRRRAPLNETRAARNQRLTEPPPPLSDLQPGGLDPELEPLEELDEELLDELELPEDEDELLLEVPPVTVNVAALLVEETGALLATKLPPLYTSNLFETVTV